MEVPENFHGVAPPTPGGSLANVSVVSAVTELNGTPEEFRTAVRALARARTRPEVTLARITPPRGLAPHAMSIAAEVGRIQRRTLRTHEQTQSPTTGRFVMLYDPSRPEPWRGAFRIVSWFRAHMDLDIGRDELLTDVSWSWLTEALDNSGALYTSEGGTASRTLEKGFGSLRETTDSVEIEVRASWTPLVDDDPRNWACAHMEAWSELLCTATGLPPFSQGVTYL